MICCNFCWMKVFLTKTDLTDPKLINNSWYEYSWYRKASWIVLLSEINSACLITPGFIHWEESWVSGWGLESGFGSSEDLSQCCHSKVVYQLGNDMSTFAVCHVICDVAYLEKEKEKGHVCLDLCCLVYRLVWWLVTCFS